LFYASFAVWFLLILFAGVGVYRLWTSLVRPTYVNWVLLPGTIVSEMAYIFGCLITGGEVRHARLIELPGARKGTREGEARTDASSGLRVLGAAVASLLAVAACIAAILAARELLDAQVIESFVVGRSVISGKGLSALPKRLPTSWNEMWSQLGLQVELLRRMCEAVGHYALDNWRGPVFLYLAACLSVRLSPVTRPMRPTLAAVVFLTGVIAVLGLLWGDFDALVRDLWPLLTYVWATLLLLLAVTLLIRGVVALVRILAGRTS